MSSMQLAECGPATDLRITHLQLAVSRARPALNRRGEVEHYAQKNRTFWREISNFLAFAPDLLVFSTSVDSNILRNCVSELYQI